MLRSLSRSVLRRSLFPPAVSAAAPFHASSAAQSRLEPHSSDRLTATNTRRIFDEDHDMFRETCRQFFEQEVVPHHDQWEEDGQISRECWLRAGELGMLGVMTPEEYGGLGLDCKYSAIVWEEQSYTGCTGPGFAMHSDIVAPYITNYGTEEQKQRILPKVST